MLKYFRQHSFRKALWMIVLLGSLFTQTQNLFACDLMDNGAQTSCCCGEDMANGCPMGGGCETSNSGVMSGCCDISMVIDPGLQEITLGDSSQNKQLQSLDAPQPPPVFIVIKQLYIPVANSNNFRIINSSALTNSSSGSSTYQITNRFRI